LLITEEVLKSDLLYRRRTHLKQMSLVAVDLVGAQHDSCLATEQYPWQTAPSYKAFVNCITTQFEEVSNLLISQPQLNSSHLFRADILYDSTGYLKTPAQKAAELYDGVEEQQITCGAVATVGQGDWPSPVIPSVAILLSLKLTRTVVRRLIPRKPKVDRVLEQTCFMYSEDSKSKKTQEQRLVVYRPHVKATSEIPWYHPSVQALAFCYHTDISGSTISIHFLPFGSEVTEPVPDRLHRTMISLLGTLVRLTKHDELNQMQILQRPVQEASGESVVFSMETDISRLSLAPSALKDTIIPQHLVQDTYTRLKETYASDLISRWVESTEPLKHVFEDLSIAAFLIELWKQIYPSPTLFPDFIDIACGNGVLVYILLKEGYTGSGFDARRRKTWDILGIDLYLTEQLCIPQPFLDALNSTPDAILPGTQIHNGIISPSTFIISNHADELTPWTPLLACLSSPSSPNPFLAIPCCSHALSGARHRYSPKDVVKATTVDPDAEQPQAGDLKALRAVKKAAQGDDKSMYGCLTRKVAALAQEMGCRVELTLMRIPSTRNIGIVGNKRRPHGTQKQHITVEEIIERECGISGGVEAAAKTWVEQAQKLQSGKGRGKVNEKRHQLEHGTADREGEEGESRNH
jgi:tRNASer (uridine44-2'-O)-methyltransferase